MPAPVKPAAASPSPPPDVPTATAAAVSAKRAYDATKRAVDVADLAWLNAMRFLGFVPASSSPNAPTPTPVTTAQLQVLADAKIAADSAFTPAIKHAHLTAQAALMLALQAAGAR